MNSVGTQAISGGFAATLVMTVLMNAAPMTGLPRMDVAGLILHFINGVLIFPLVYAYALEPRLLGSGWQRGTVWGTILWFLTQAVVAPAMGGGFFSCNDPGQDSIVFTSFLGHLVYGATLGTVTGLRTNENFPKGQIFSPQSTSLMNFNVLLLEPPHVYYLASNCPSEMRKRQWRI
jgi:hypothetical protein